MKNKWILILSVIQILIGAAGIAVFASMALNGASLIRWYIPLTLAIGFIMIGVMGIIVWKKS